MTNDKPRNLGYFLHTGGAREIATSIAEAVEEQAPTPVQVRFCDVRANQIQAALYHADGRPLNTRTIEISPTVFGLPFRSNFVTPGAQFADSVVQAFILLVNLLPKTEQERDESAAEHAKILAYFHKNGTE